MNLEFKKDLEDLLPSIINIETALASYWMKYTNGVRGPTAVLGTSETDGVICLLNSCINFIKDIKAHVPEETKVQKLFKDLTTEEINELETILKNRAEKSGRGSLRDVRCVNTANLEIVGECVRCMKKNHYNPVLGNCTFHVGNGVKKYCSHFSLKSFLPMENVTKFCKVCENFPECVLRDSYKCTEFLRIPFSES